MTGGINSWSADDNGDIFRLFIDEQEEDEKDRETNR